MQKQYGERISDYCRNCCNCQHISPEDHHKVCIAYSLDIPWDMGNKACGLFNRAFYGIRPRYRRLEELFKSTKEVKQTSTEAEQRSLFDDF